VRLRLNVVVPALAIVLLPMAAQAQAPLKKEPAMGQLREGQRVLVDDGSCPTGQIKEVIGGNHTSVGGRKNIERQRRCIPRR
jgi:hypothetical protein